MKNYQVIERESREQFEEAVNTAIHNGWILLGGVSVRSWIESWEDLRHGGTDYEVHTKYSQAMIRRAEDAHGAVCKSGEAYDCQGEKT